eukprot:199865-Prymnesium_polylepis.1
MLSRNAAFPFMLPSACASGRPRSRSPSTARTTSPTRSSPSRSACPPGTMRTTRLVGSRSTPKPPGPRLRVTASSPAAALRASSPEAAAPTDGARLAASYLARACSSRSSVCAFSAAANASAARAVSPCTLSGWTRST